MKNASLQQQISELEDSIRRTEVALEEHRARLAKLKAMNPITNKDLYARMGDILVINVDRGNGIRVKIKDPSIYVSEDQVSIIRKYVMDVYSSNYIITVETPNYV